MEQYITELESIYEQLEQELSTIHLCKCCGKCCNFATNGMRLYIYHIERLYGQIKHNRPFTLKEDGSCYFQKNNLCSVHSSRPLGCRTQFCTATLQDLYEKYAKQIEALELKYNISYEYANAFEE